MCCGLPVFFPWFLGLLCLQVVVPFFFFFFFSSFFSSVCHIPLRGGRGGHETVCFFYFYLFIFSFDLFPQSRAHAETGIRIAYPGTPTPPDGSKIFFLHVSCRSISEVLKRRTYFYSYLGVVSPTRKPGTWYMIPGTRYQVYTI